MRKALCVGINYYAHVSKLNGCVNDAISMRNVLSRHGDNTPNFSTELYVADTQENAVSRGDLKDKIEKLFSGKTDAALLYFSGHGYIENTGGYLITSEVKRGDEGLAIRDILEIAAESDARNKIIILDCCHAGSSGNLSCNTDFALVKEGTTILTACRAEEYAVEINGRGVFTSLLVEALTGGAMNLVGDVTPGSVYAYIDQALGPWEQRPMFKTNVQSFISLRRNKPPISLEDLHKLPILFKEQNIEYPLDPSYEPTSDTKDEENTKIFAILQRYNRVNLLVPNGAEHMYYAAMESKSCVLTALGKHYWQLVKNGRI